jgi:hypothetical protein
MTWKKGQSGNLQGARLHKAGSAELELRAAAQAWGKKAVKVAADIMQDEDVAPNTRLQAADLLLNRGFGKPIQPHANPDLSPIDWNAMGTGELLEILRKMEMSLNGVPGADVIAAQNPNPLGTRQ